MSTIKMDLSQATHQRLLKHAKAFGGDINKTLRHILDELHPIQPTEEKRHPVNPTQKET